MTKVYYTFCEKLSDIEYQKALSFLSRPMQERIGKYLKWQDAHAFLYGKLLLRQALAELGSNYDLEQMKEESHGKPYFPRSPFSFNISHSEEYIVCVISTDEQAKIGIDIEKIKPILLSSFNTVWCSEEKKQINNLKKFYTYWTRKEAVIKADGRGMSIPLNTIDTTSCLVSLKDETYHLKRLDIDENYIMHLASLQKFENEDSVICAFIEPNTLVSIGKILI